MVVKNRGTAAPAVETVLPSGRGALPPLEAALLAAGFARSPAEARVLARSLLAALRAAGVTAPQDASARDMLSAFQGLQGLPVTGLLDEGTAQQLLDLGLLRHPDGTAPQPPARGRPPADAGSTRAPPKPQTPREGDFVLGARPPFAELGLSVPRPAGEGHGDAGAPRAGDPAFVLQHEQMRARTKLHRDPAPCDLSGLLESLALQGFLGAGRGAKRLESALRAFQVHHGFSPTGKLDPSTVFALVQQGALPPGTETLRTPAEGPSFPSAQGQPTDGAISHSLEREEGGAPRSAGQSPSSGGAEVGSEYVSPAADERNAPAGDDDTRDSRRGHATLHEENPDQESFYEMPTMSAQLIRALDDLVSDGGPRGVPTYSWDVTLYRPGIYGRRQPAEAVLHVVVHRAASLDPVWQEARDAVAARLAELEPASCAPSDEDFTNALRRARARAASPR